MVFQQIINRISSQQEDINIILLDFYVMAHNDGYDRCLEDIQIDKQIKQ